VDGFLPPFEPRQVLDPQAPITIGAMVGPEAFTEVRYLMHVRQQRALAEIPRIAADFAAAFGRHTGGLVDRYLVEDADTVVVALGSVLGSVRAVVDDLRADGVAAGALGISCFRPWPRAEVHDALARVRHVLVVERAFAPGVGGIVGQDVRLALDGTGVPVVNTVLGLGGRPVTRVVLRRVVDDVLSGRLTPGQLHFPDLDQRVVERELARPVRAL
jgi:pyruvate ferredoxin oxidoreductase alpha subunit